MMHLSGVDCLFLCSRKFSLSCCHTGVQHFTSVVSRLLLPVSELYRRPNGLIDPAENVNDIFAFVDDDGNGRLDRVECRVLFYLLAEGSVHQCCIGVCVQLTNVRFCAPLLQAPQTAPAHGYQHSADWHHTQAPQAPASQHGLTHCNSYSQPPQAASHAVHQGLQHGNSWPQSQ
eukprot:8508-Heterococcus_DN1.PRE.1